MAQKPTTKKKPTGTVRPPKSPSGEKDPQSPKAGKNSMAPKPPKEIDYKINTSDPAFWRQLYLATFRGGKSKLTQLAIHRWSVILNNACQIVAKSKKADHLLAMDEARMDLSISIKVFEKDGIEECKTTSSWSEKHREAIDSVIPDQNQMSLPLNKPSDKEDVHTD